MTFNDFDLDPRLQQNLQTMGFEQPTPIQSATIAQALEGRDILGSAETGTGKTAAFLLPLLQKLIQSPSTNQPRALVLLPTRELALQVAEHATQLSHGLRLRIAVVYGGVKSRPQEDALRRGVDIVIATPGRLLDHAGRRHVAFAALQVLVIDEADPNDGHRLPARPSPHRALVAARSADDVILGDVGADHRPLV